MQIFWQLILSTAQEPKESHSDLCVHLEDKNYLAIAENQYSKIDE